jgi:hypothetical protein
MKKRIGLIDLCTSHPSNWVPILRELGYDVAACWDSGDTRPPDFAKTFAAEFKIPHPVARPEDLLGQVDMVIIHSANWDKHVPLAAPFVEAGVAVLVDKPAVGNLKDANQLLDWARQGRRVTGGSNVRFAREIKAFHAQPAAERGTAHTVFTGCAVDDFNYAIHAYAAAAGLLGPGIRSARYLGSSAQKHIRLTWQDGRTAILAIGKTAAWLPFYFTAVTEKAVRQSMIDTGQLYRSFLESVMPYLSGAEDAPPVPMEALLEPELAALAARQSWQQNGAEIQLSDLRLDDPGFDGRQFAEEYRRARLAPPK